VTYPTRLPLPPEPERAAPAETDGGTTRQRRARSTKVLASVAAVAVVLAIAIGVSRTQLAGHLSTSDASLSATRGQLDASTAEVTQLQARVQLLEEAQAVLHTQLDDARAAERNTQESLTACQDLFRLGAGFPNGGMSSDAKAQAASMLVSCFEGKLPRF